MKKKRKLTVDSNIRLDVCHTTSVPPYVRKMDDIVREHLWFLGLLAKQDRPSRTAYFFGLQNPPEKVRTFAELLALKGLGIRFMTLAYDGKNEYGGGFATLDEKLTEAGRALIQMMGGAGMVLDLSHAGHRTARMAIDFIKEKSLKVRVVATHTACHHVYKHGRCLPDDVLHGIRDLGGLVGLAAITWMLDETNNGFDPFFRHLEHLVNVVGEDCVCLGTDGVYTHLDSRADRERFEVLKEKIDPKGQFGARHPEQPHELNRPDRLLILLDEMYRRNWPKDRIDKVMGWNLATYLGNL